MKVRTFDQGDVAESDVMCLIPQYIHFAKLSTYHLEFSTLLEKL